MKRKWRRWKDGFPPVVGGYYYFYSTEDKKVHLDTWCGITNWNGNKDEVVRNLRSGKWKSYGVSNTGYVTHWCEAYFPKPPRGAK